MIPFAEQSAVGVASQGSGLLFEVYEEFCARRERGDHVDADAFCAEFPALQSRLGKLLAAQLFLDANPAMLVDPSDIAWPECGQSYLDFHLVLELGRGAFARVFLATEPKLGGRLVALKVAWHGGAEAEILGRLHHPHIVPVHSVNADQRAPLTAVCMPYLGSATLADVLARLDSVPALPVRARFLLEVAGKSVHPLDPSAYPAEPAPILHRGTYADGVRAIGSQLADALAFLHERGIYHQDLKPSNVLLTPAGNAMLLDFNLSADARATALLGGTLAYMAPEQLQAQAATGPELDVGADARSDIFALGVILFELATGKHPYDLRGSKLGAAELRSLLLERQRVGTPSVRQLNPAIEKPLADLIERCLSWHAHQRPTGAELAAALRHQLRPAARVQRFLGRHRRSVVAVLCAAVVLAIAALGVAAARPPLAQRQFDAGVAYHDQGAFQQAVASFSAVLENDPDHGEALLARARAFQAWSASAPDYVQAALADYHRADRLMPNDGRPKAGVAYCLTLSGGQTEVVIANYQAALKLGTENAELLNNLGVCQLKANRSDEAEKCLNRAVELNANLQSAYHNRALVRLHQALALMQPAVMQKGGVFMVDPEGTKKRRLERSEKLQAGMKDIATAIKLGPLSAELCMDAARLHALAARDDPALNALALTHLQQAVELGSDPRKLKLDVSFNSLKTNARFQQMCAGAPPTQPPAPAVRIVNPVNDLRR